MRTPERAFDTMIFKTGEDVNAYMLLRPKSCMMDEETELWWAALAHAAAELRLRLDKVRAWYGRDSAYDYALAYGDHQDIIALDALTRAYMLERDPAMVDRRYAMLARIPEVMQAAKERFGLLFPGGKDGIWSAALAVVLMEDAMRRMADEARAALPPYVGPETRLSDRFYHIQGMFQTLPNWYAAELSRDLFPTWYRPEPEEVAHEWA